MCYVGEGLYDLTLLKAVEPAVASAAAERHEREDAQHAIQ